MDKALVEMLLKELVCNKEDSDTRPPIGAIGSSTKIAVLQRGWVVVGKFSRTDDDCVLESSAVIRSWGTSKGLGEIATNGPVSDKTVLDPCGTVRFDIMTAVMLIDCEDKKWSSHL